MQPRPYPAAALAGALAALLVGALPASAQSMGRGFLFRAPIASLGVHGGLGYAMAGSDIFTFSREQLTLDRSDFSGPTLGGELAVRVAPRLDLAFGATYTGRTADSEDRQFIGVDDIPVEQTTEFIRVPVTASLKAYLLPRGRSVGTLSWLPAPVAPYVGVGAGALWYRFRQEGEFVDYVEERTFFDTLESSGWAPAVQGMAGVDVSLSPRLVLTGDLRYIYAEAELDTRDFDEAFEPIDLSGMSATIGLSVRF